jgi:hypothetical protein
VRRKVFLVLAMSAVALLAATATAATEPIVSPKADPYYPGLQGTKGFGQVKPREIYYGGDPTGLVCRIHWHSWGGPIARGTGVGWYINGSQSVSQGHPATATVVASKLGTWNGRPAYNRLRWSFPNHGGDRRAPCT